MNTFIGMQTGYKNKTGERNIYIGNNSGYFNNDGDDNVFLGTNSGYYNKVNNNIFVGTNTGYNNYYGENNIFLGKNSGTNNLSSSNNIFLGESSGKYTGNIWNQESNSNIFLGSGSGYSNTLGNTNICIGKNAGYWLNESNNKVIIETPKKTNINTNNVTNYANRLYFTINSMFEYQQNDYIKIINSLSDEEIVTLSSKNNLTTASNTYTYTKGTIEFYDAANSIANYPYIQHTNNQYDFSKSTLLPLCL